MTDEKTNRPMSGYPMVVLALVLLAAFIATLATGIRTENGFFVIPLPFLVLAEILTLAGFVVLQPNEASVLLLFGKYVGSIREDGFWWVNPFYTKRKISLRLRTHNSERLKVNDKTGNPIEIAAVVVWRVHDTYAASFDVDDYVGYVNLQSEVALRHLATLYPYDSWDENEVISLRSHIDEVSRALMNELAERLAKAGVEIHEARLSHLAYAAEIAEAMLKRQQAGAIVAARQKIVEGAVGMVNMALQRLRDDNIIELDDERKASMVSNLLVVLCGETHAQPVVNAGTLYH
jgi:regulator of protease activity HflC (stomatin/prohibitin superfamily)